MIGVMGAGAFGTALAVALSNGGRHVSLVARRSEHADEMARSRTNHRLPGLQLPSNLGISASLAELEGVDTVLLAIPTQALAQMLAEHRDVLSGKALVACCKGVDLQTGVGPTGLITELVSDATPAILSGPSFAADIGKGLPTALTLAASDEAVCESLQQDLSTTTLRLYRTTDVAGVEVGGALKNVVAIACGAAIGAGLGESARAALMTRGYAEMVRFAVSRGADAKTLSGLSGLGDLALTSTSQKSRNYRFGLDLGRGNDTHNETTEGKSTAQAVAKLAREEGLDMPLSSAVAQIVDGSASIQDTIDALLGRPLKPE